MNTILLRYSGARISKAPALILRNASSMRRSRFAKPGIQKDESKDKSLKPHSAQENKTSKELKSKSVTEEDRNSVLLKKITELTAKVDSSNTHPKEKVKDRDNQKVNKKDHIAKETDKFWSKNENTQSSKAVKVPSENSKSSNDNTTNPTRFDQNKRSPQKDGSNTKQHQGNKKEQNGSYKKDSKDTSKKDKKDQKREAPKEVEKALPQLIIPKFTSVSNLSTLIKVRLPAFLKKLEELGFENMTHDFILDADTAALIVEEYGYEAVINDVLGADLFPSPPGTDSKKLKPRPPVVTIMGHVDHGKTTILDYLRKSSIVKGEHGGITQHIGAFSVKTPVSKKVITFLDTPGHAAFLKMRERGANMTDVVVLVVAAEDSVMPQTLEAIKHAKNAGVSLVVAVNKCDKEDANPDKVVSDLSRHGIDVEDYGGEVPVVRVSGKTGFNMDTLEETIVTVSDMLELTAEDKGVPVEGWIVESQMKKGLGNVATMLIKKGTLKPGSILVAGTTYCKVRAMKDEFGKPVKSAGPSVPVEVTGWKELPEAGDITLEAKNEAFAKQVISNREKRNAILHETEQIEEINNRRLLEIEEKAREDRIQELQLEGLTLEEIKQLEPELFAEVDTTVKKVPFIIKADVSGSAEAVAESIRGLGNDEIKSLVIYQEVGPPSESDIDRAASAGAQILAFNINTPKDVMNSASTSGVVIKEFNVIYHLIEDVLDTLVRALPPLYETKVISTADVREIFEISMKKGSAPVKIAGCKVSNGVLKRSQSVRLMRDGEEIYRGSIKQLKIHKDDVTEVKTGAECGVCLDNSSLELLSGDVIENIEQVEVTRHL